MLAIDPRSFKPNRHEDIIAGAKLRAAKKPKLLPGQNGKRGKWAQNVLESASEVTLKTGQNLDQMKENLVGIHAAKNGVIELLSDDDEKIELIDENKVFSVKVKKEDIPKCWIEVYLQMPKNHGNDMKYNDAQQSGTLDENSISNDCKIEKGNLSKKRNTRVLTLKSRNDRVRRGEKKDSAGKKEESSIENLESDCQLNIDTQIIPKGQEKEESGFVDVEKNKNDRNVLRILDESDVRTEGRYVQIDLYNGGPKVGSMIDKPKNIENSVRCRRPVSYVIAVDESGLLIDVTNRYSCCLSNTQKSRPADIQWWTDFIRDSEISSTIYYNKKNKNYLKNNITNNMTNSNIKLLKVVSSSSPTIIDIDDDINSNSDKTPDKYILENRTSEISSYSSSGADDAVKYDNSNMKDSEKKIVISDGKRTDNEKREILKTSLENGEKRELEVKKESEMKRERIMKREKARLSQQLLAEQEEFKCDALLEPLPTTISGFKNNSLYVLERDIKVSVCMINVIYYIDHIY